MSIGILPIAILAFNAKGGLMPHRNFADDGFHSELVENAYFCGNLEIPLIRKPDAFIVPDGIIPFSKMDRSLNHDEFVGF